MSATIGINDLKFVIFGAGHDYTLADSGDGDVQVFSHPFVPLNSVMYAGQWYFLVPDENGDPMDCVKDDIAHCTFTPALGTAFDTEGEITVECNYHREYIYDEETLVVDKTVSQVITVVNHGSVTNSVTYFDLYSDGYGFFRPSSVNTADYNIGLRGYGSVVKVSSLPWRVTVLGHNGYDFLDATHLTDVSELQYADVSNVVLIHGFLRGCHYITSEMLKDAIGGWNLGNLQIIEQFAYYSDSFTDLSFFEKQTFPKLYSLWQAFSEMKTITSLHGLENADFSHVTNMVSTFNGCVALSDMTALSNKDLSSVTSMELCFNNCRFTNVDFLAGVNPTALTNVTAMLRNCILLQNVDGLSGWTSHITAMAEMCMNCRSLVDVTGFANLDVSAVTEMRSVFEDCVKLRSLDGLENLDTGNVTTFYRMFCNDHWISDISALNSWNFGSATNTAEMFSGISALTDLSNIALDLSNVSNMASMFNTMPYLFAVELDRYCYETAYWYIDYDGNEFSKLGITEQYVTHDASEAENWTVSISGAGAFNTEWANRPSWN